MARVSVSSAGLEGNTSSGNTGGQPSSVSSDGRYVAFDSAASNLVLGDTNLAIDVFVRNLVAGTTTRVSVDSTGAQANGHSTAPSTSADGRYVAFESSASNLVPSDTNGVTDMFLRDLAAGTTSRVSVDSTGGQANGNSRSPSTSPDGRYVAFDSAASNLVLGDTNLATDVFVRDRVAGTTTRVSVDSQGVQGLGGSFRPSISSGGGFIAFDSQASNLVLGDTSGFDVFVRDLGAGTTTRVSMNETGGQANGNSVGPSISRDGRYVAFGSAASNLVVGDTNLATDVFVRDRVAGTTSRVSVDATGGQANGGSWHPSISADGRYVTFPSTASNLVPGDTNGAPDVFRYDRGEKTPPTISSFTASPSRFSPNGDGIKDTTTFSASVSDESPTLSWTITISNALGVTVRSYSGSIQETAGTASAAWDGKDSSGVVVTDGTYTATLRVTDFWGNTGTQTTSVVVQNLPPTITGLTASPNPFSPNGDSLKDATRVSATISDQSPPTTWTLVIKNGAGTTVRSFSGSGASSTFGVSQEWDGRDSTGGVVADATYTATLTATDDVGNSASRDLSLTVDTVAPPVTAVSVSPARFSPNGDGYLDTATFSGTIAEALPWTLRVKNSSATTVSTYTGTCTGAPCNVTQLWDGSGAFSDGTYTGFLEATDAAGNTGSGQASVVRDVTPPTITGYHASNPAFSPDGVAPDDKDTTEFQATVSDAWTPISWRLDVKSAGTIVRTFTGEVSGTPGTVRQVWDGKDSSGTAVDDGVYTAAFTATDAGRNSRTAGLTVEVDNSPPVVAFIAPRAGGNTIYTSQPIVAQVTDRRAARVTVAAEAPRTSPVRGDQPGSGIDGTSISLVVRNLSGGQPDQNPSATLTGDILRSQEAALLAGSTYEAMITLRDRAGTQVETTGRFLAMQSATATLPDVWIPQQEPDSVVLGGPTDPFDRYIWQVPQATAGSFTVTLQNTLHTGDGWVPVKFAPSAASVTYTVNGVPGPALHPLEAEAELPVPFTVTQTGSVTMQTREHSGATSGLTALVPKGADPGSVRLAMDPTPAREASFRMCKDPTAGSGCGPDPIATAGRQQGRWGPWADLMDVDPYGIPEAVGQLVGLTLPPNGCTGAPPSLAQAIDHLGQSLGTPDSVASGVTLGSALSEGLARIVECAANHIPLLPPVPSSASDSQRAEWLAAQRDVLSTVKNFPQSAAFPEGCTVIDTLGHVEVCDASGTTHGQDRMILIDQGGSDTYTNNAGGASLYQNSPARRALALLLDLGGNDTYNQNRSSSICDLYPSVGAGSWGGVGILVDISGSDTFKGRHCSQGSGYHGGAGYLLDLGPGSDIHTQISSSESAFLNIGAATQQGFGFLVDAAGSATDTDRYTTYGQYNIGYGDLQSVGLVVGGIGTSTYSNQTPIGSTISGWGVGAGSATGVGAILDPGGKDSYACGYPADYCLGAAIDYSAAGAPLGRGPMGLLVDRGSSDDIYSLGPGTWGGLGRADDVGPLVPGVREAGDAAALGVLVDLGGKDSYTCSAKSCLGVGWFGAEGVFLDLGAADLKDTYTCASTTYKPLASSVPFSGSCPGRGNNAVWLGEQRPPSDRGNTYFGAGVDLYSP